MEQDNSKNGYSPVNGEVSRAEFEALADAHNLTIADGENRRGPNPFTGEGENGFCWRWPELNGHDRSGNFKKSRREMLDFFGVGTSRYSQQGATNGHFSEFYPPIKPLEARGLTGETLRFFGVVRIQSGKWNGWKYPTFHADKTQARDRFKNATGKPKYAWWKNGDGREPDAYNLQNIQDGISEVWAVGGEVDVWAMHQNGFEAVAPFGETQGASRLVDALLRKRAGRIRILLDNDDAGRAGAAALARECEQQGLSFCVHEFSGGDGHDVCDEFSRVGFDRERFRAAILALPEIEIENVSDGAQNSTSAPNKPRFPRLKLREIFERPRLEYLIDGVFIETGTGVLSGDYGSFKSFLALDMALSVATGNDWQGRATKQGAVVYITPEGAYSHADRVKAWMIRHGVQELPENFELIEMPVQIGEPAQCAALIAELREFSPALVILDTVAKCNVGRDENDATAMGLFTHGMEAIARELGAFVLAIHHNNKNGTARGSNSLPANVDASIPLKRAPGRVVSVECDRIKGAPFEAFALIGRVVEIGDKDERGRPVTSLVFDPTDAPTQSLTKSDQTREQVLDALKNSPNGLSATKWHEAACATIGGNGISSSRFYDFREEFLTSGKISQDGRIYKFTPIAPITPNRSKSEREFYSDYSDDALASEQSEFSQSQNRSRSKLERNSEPYGAHNPTPEAATENAARDFAANFGDSDGEIDEVVL